VLRRPVELAAKTGHDHVIVRTSSIIAIILNH
jgi:hypothetical protein